MQLSSHQKSQLISFHRWPWIFAMVLFQLADNKIMANETFTNLLYSYTKSIRHFAHAKKETEKELQIYESLTCC